MGGINMTHRYIRIQRYIAAGVRIVAQLQGAQSPISRYAFTVCCLLDAVFAQKVHAVCNTTTGSGCPANTFTSGATISSSTMNANFTDIWSYLGVSGGSATTGLPIAAGGTGATTASGARTALGLGSAAVLTAGTALNNVVQLDGSAKLPAVDGSQLTSVNCSTATGLTIYAGAPAALPSSGQLQLIVLSDIVPIMTSNTAPSGTVSASTYYGETTNPWRAIGGTGYGWLTASSDMPAWLQYNLASPQVVSAYSIIPWSADNFPARTPTSWTFQGSNNGSTWTTLDTRTGFTSWTISTAYLFSATNTTSYSYYRLYITANVGGNAYTGIQQIKLFGTTPGSGIPTLLLRDSAGGFQKLSL